MDNPLPQGAQAVELLSPEAHHWRAEREMADALSAFQAQVQPATELTLRAVVEAAKPAFQRGFCFSVRSTDEGTAVLLMHRSGAQQSAESEAYDADFQLSARLLAGLLGIPVDASPRPSKAESEKCSEVGAAAAATPVAVPAQAVHAQIAPGGSNGEEADGLLEADPADDPDLEPLNPEQISTLTAMLKAMARSDKEAWKRFSIAFRDHFQVPRTARTITDRITQRRHADFIDRFEQELINTTLPAAHQGPGSVAPTGAPSESEPTGAPSESAPRGALSESEAI
ncbi:hypothetical protein [Synechococcus sp. EJ6-Ellesmere]|uniref:hypothetical protein n=1 Tax=Synechococcus sp. EJ6-Ellesmere TaxID=2823734 RepID=UPI0020CFDE42|nr:hypothetical protein [Synechococcus sp. EJ6-Ellesmere]MCP9825594.1 hypothetical protein [Synechococcus sp. EJ6-Ellesmere]